MAEKTNVPAPLNADQLLKVFQGLHNELGTLKQKTVSVLMAQSGSNPTVHLHASRVDFLFDQLMAYMPVAQQVTAMFGIAGQQAAAEAAVAAGNVLAFPQSGGAS